MKNKKFNSVKMMREIRKKLSEDFPKLSVNEKIDLLEKEFPEIKIKKTEKTSATSRLIKKPEFREHHT